MPCDPRLGKVLVLSAMFRCVLPMMCVAACLTRDPFHNSLQNRAEISKVEIQTPTLRLSHRNVTFDRGGVSVFLQVKAALSSSSYSDYLVFIRAVMGWRTVQHEGHREDRDEYLDGHCLSRFSLRFIKGDRRQSFDVIVKPHFTQGFCPVALMQVSSLSSAPTCMKQSWYHKPTTVSVMRLSAMSAAMRRSCLKLYCWLDSTPTLFR